MDNIVSYKNRHIYIYVYTVKPVFIFNSDTFLCKMNADYPQWRTQFVFDSADELGIFFHLEDTCFTMAC